MQTQNYVYYMHFFLVLKESEKKRARTFAQIPSKPKNASKLMPAKLLTLNNNV